MVKPALSILILTEDSSPSAHETWTKLARKLLLLVEEHTRTNHVHFQPAEHATRLGVRANLWKSWKSPNPRDQRPLRNLRRRLANKVLEDRVPGYVLFHFDGDRPWSESDSCQNDRKLEEFKQSLRSEVEDNLRAQPAFGYHRGRRAAEPDLPRHSILQHRVLALPEYAAPPGAVPTTLWQAPRSDRRMGSGSRPTRRGAQAQGEALHRQPQQSRARRELHAATGGGSLSPRSVLPRHRRAPATLPRSPGSATRHLERRHQRRIGLATSIAAVYLIPAHPPTIPNAQAADAPQSVTPTCAHPPARRVASHRLPRRAPLR